MRTSQSEINGLVKEISKLTGIANNKADAIKNGQDKYLAVDFASCYGGYRLVMIGVANGGHYGAFDWGSTCPRVSAGVFSERLSGIIIGLEYASKSQDI